MIHLRGDDLAFGQDGDDWMSVYHGYATLLWGEGDDPMESRSPFAQGDYLMFGEGGNDTIEGDDFLSGGAGDDQISGGADDDYIDGGAGDDWIDAGRAFDEEYITAGDTDTLAGGAGDDWLDGAVGSDYLDGGAGNDTLYGGILSASGSTLAGGDGDDYLVGVEGGTVFFGGTGADLINPRYGPDNWIMDFEPGADRIGARLPPGAETIEDIATQVGPDLLLDFGDTTIWLANLALSQLDGVEVLA